MSEKTSFFNRKKPKEIGYDHLSEDICKAHGFARSEDEIQKSFFNAVEKITTFKGGFISQLAEELENNLSKRELAMLLSKNILNDIRKFAEKEENNKEE